jgi:hypothetical protein
MLRSALLTAAEIASLIAFGTAVALWAMILSSAA